MSRFTFESYWENTEPEWDRGDVPWIVRILVRWGIIALGFLAAEAVVNWLWEPPDRFIIDGWTSLMAASAIFLAVRAVFRPVLMFLTCPLQLLTLGLFVFVINTLILVLTEQVGDWFDVSFNVAGILPAFVGALVISAVSFSLDRIVRRNMFGPRVAIRTAALTTTAVTLAVRAARPSRLPSASWGPAGGRIRPRALSGS